MATGYTQPIYEGQDITFEQFMLRCSRQFGALIHMREEPLDALIPDEILPSVHHLREIERTEKELADFLSHRPTLEELEGRYIKEIEDIETRNQKEIERQQVLLSRYTEMLEKVKAWNPPTEEHVNLKKFAIEQLESSISWDCKLSATSTLPKKEDWIEYHLNLDKQLKKELNYHREQYRREAQAARTRTEWIQALKKSLKTE